MLKEYWKFSIEDEKEFEELKKEYAHETANQEEDQSASVEDTVD